MTDKLPQKSLTTPIPTNETERLAALHHYKILDTPPEAAFDRITRLAVRLFDMPTALISLVDESRAWFKSCVGFDAHEVSRDVTLCSFSVLTDEPLIIPDTRLDDRFACNPIVQGEPGVRFYAGAPLLSHEGFNLGTLCLLDTQPRERLTAEQQATLVDLAAIVVDELELRLAAHKIAQSEEKYRTLFESIDEGFCIVEVLFEADGRAYDHRILQANAAFERQTGILNPNGKTASELAPGLEQYWNDLYAQVVHTGESVRIENCSDALVRWFDVLVWRVGDASTCQVALVFTDITERKRAEAERERLLQQSQVAWEEAENANRIKDEFLAVLSHELRSPLNPILGWTRLLQNGKLDPTRQTEALKTIERNAKLQSQLIEDLLDISCIMQGKLSLTSAPVSLTFVISAAIETVRLAAEAKNIALALDFDAEIAPISGDAARLQQVVWNLLSNAVKFTPHGGQVTVELRQLDGLAQMRVIDPGKGINPNFLPYVFEYFRQEDGSTTRRFGGLGLGLAIVRQIVELHGGTVRAESQGENQGATFIVQLPQVQQAKPFGSKPTIAPADTEAPLDKIQILLVDDDTDTLEFQTFVLEQSGAMVTAVTSGLEALQVLEQFMPDAIVSDVGMAEMDGYMLLRQIRSRPPNRGGTIPALALTAYAAEVDHQRAIQAGFQTFITKPVEPEGLILAIISLLERNQLTIEKISLSER